MKLHDEGAPPREFKIDITKEEQELANELLNPEKPQPMRKAGITKSALKTPRVGRENYDQVIFDHIKKGYFGSKICEFGENYLIRGRKCPHWFLWMSICCSFKLSASVGGKESIGSWRNSSKLCLVQTLSFQPL